MQNDSTSSDDLKKPYRPLSGAQRRKIRKLAGLPPYTPAEGDYKKAYDKRRARRGYAQRGALIDTIKLERGCADCGYSDHPAALHFDHLPGFEKRGIIARMAISTPLETLWAEIEKCEVVCANCHAIRTQLRRDQRKAEKSSTSVPSPEASR